MTRMVVAIIAVLFSLVAAAWLFAQPVPELTPVQERDVRISLLTETVVALQTQLDTLRHDCNVIQFQTDRQQRTPPPKDGYVWSWKPKPDGSPEGYMKSPDEKKGGP